MSPIVLQKLQDAQRAASVVETRQRPTPAMISHKSKIVGDCGTRDAHR